MIKFRKLFKQSILILAAGVLLLDPLQVHAQAVDLKFFSKNDIMFWNPNDCNAAANAAGGIPNLVGNKNAEKMWNFFVGIDGTLKPDQRLNPIQAAGVMGNLRQESGENFNPDAENPSSGAYGIAQWLFGRKTALLKKADQLGVKKNDLAFQLKFLYDESNSRNVTAREFKSRAVNNNEWKTLQSLKTIEDATLFWHANFEISEDTLQDIQRTRLVFAKNVYASFKDKVPAEGAAGGTVSSSTTGTCGQFAGGDFSATLLAYAWPRYEANKTENQPAYQKAMEKAKADGQYLGAAVGSQLGIDCGAFVTRLMIDSGFEPNYNYGGKLSAGAGPTSAQEAWLKANWKVVGKGNEVKVGGDASDDKVLRAGDVAIDSAHTFVFVGKIEGFESNTAAASLSSHSPMAGGDTITAARWTWYRKK